MSSAPLDPAAHRRRGRQQAVKLNRLGDHREAVNELREVAEKIRAEQRLAVERRSEAAERPGLAAIEERGF